MDVATFAEIEADFMARVRRIWELFTSTPPPLGYDPGIIWPGPDAPTFSLLRLTASRIELSQMLAPTARRVWRA